MLGAPPIWQPSNNQPLQENRTVMIVRVIYFLLIDLMTEVFNITNAVLVLILINDHTLACEISDQAAF